MPYYEYECPKCNLRFDVVKAMSQYDRPELCECGSEASRQMPLPSKVHASAGDWNRVEFNPALGQWTKSWKHGRQIAKEKGLIEIGNEKTETIHKHFDTAREEKREQRYRDAGNLK